MLHIEMVGKGPLVVLVHGWGMHGGVWLEVAEALATSYTVAIIDLPGHGRSALGDAPFTLDHLVDELVVNVAEPAVWVGWSLGGAVAARLATRAPDRVKGVMLVASSPCFAAKPQWPHGMAEATLAQFAAALAANYKILLDTFVSLQSMGAMDSREQIRLLRDRLFEHGVPDMRALRGGLDILQSLDARDEWAALTVPLWLVYGDRDRIVPSSLVGALRGLLPTARLDVIAGAAHAPFLSHFTEFVALTRRFCERVTRHG
jgi:pimeloyl-[acyl-carrier protein] methyl ester esterase